MNINVEPATLERDETNLKITNEGLKKNDVVVSSLDNVTKRGEIYLEVKIPPLKPERDD